MKGTHGLRFFVRRGIMHWHIHDRRASNPDLTYDVYRTRREARIKCNELNAKHEKHTEINSEHKEVSNG